MFVWIVVDFDALASRILFRERGWVEPAHIDSVGAELSVADSVGKLDFGEGGVFSLTAKQF